MGTSEDRFDDPIELDDEMLQPGKSLTPAPSPVTPYKQWSDPMPARLTPVWVEGQLHKAVWKDDRSAINPNSIVFMAQLRAQGLSKKGVMARLGLSQGTWHSWSKKAQEGLQPYLLWSQCMSHAEADMEEELLDNIRNKAQDDWKASQWLLGKLQPEDYSDKLGTTNNTINVHGDVNAKQTTVNSLSNDDIAGILSVFGEIEVGSPPVEAEVVEDE